MSQPIPRLMLIVSRERVRAPLAALVADAVTGGVDAVQLREPGMEPEALQTLAATLQAAVAGRAALLVNREVGVAAALGIGVHLPERAMPPAAARSCLGPAALIGRSVHDAWSATASAGADYLLAGHVFPTASHPGQTPLRLDGLRRIVAAAPCPTLAVGGIDAGNAGAAIRAGARGVAAIGAIVDAPDPAAAAAQLRAAVEAALQEERRRMDRATSGTATIEIVVNGKPTTIAAGASISDFLASKRMTDAMAIVELNGTIVRRPDYPAITLAPNDRLEVVHAVGGGSGSRPGATRSGRRTQTVG